MTPAFDPKVDRSSRHVASSIKGEFAGLTLLFQSHAKIRTNLECYRTWFNEHRPHQGLGLRSPAEAARVQVARCRRNPLEGERFTLAVDHVGGHRALPIYTLRRAA